MNHQAAHNQPTNTTALRRGVQRYGFNGKEDDFEIKGNGNGYDFGSRFYDARLGRWLSVDIFRHLAPDITPYRMLFNSPIRFVDKDGNFEVDPSLMKFNHFMLFLSKLSLEYSKKSSEFRRKVNSISESNDKEIMSWLTNGSGPRLMPETFKSTWGYVYGATKHRTLTDVNGEPITDYLGREYVEDMNLISLSIGLIKRFESIMSNPNSTRVDKKAAELLMEAVILHEIAHFGDLQDNVFNNNYDEVGDQLEKMLYGQKMNFDSSVSYVEDNYPNLVAEDNRDKEKRDREFKNEVMSKVYEIVRESCPPVSTNVSDVNTEED
ncbi:MAG: RHS repeat domain-containing protein [Pseudomonadota bacterium]